MENEEERPQMSRARKIHLGLVDLVLTVAGLVVVALGAWAIWRENLALADTALGAGLVRLFAATVERLESLKGLGMEAKTKELKFQVDRTERAHLQLCDLAEFTGTNFLRMVSAGG